MRYRNLSRNRIILTISLVFVILLVLFCSYQYVYKPGWVNFKQSVIGTYTSTYAYYKEMVSEGKLRSGSLKYSFFKDLSFLRYFPSQITAFFKNILNRNFYLSLVGIFFLLIVFSLLGIPVYSKKIPAIFLPLLGFINLACILVFLLFFKVKYTFYTFLLIALSVSFLIVMVRLLLDKNCYKTLSIRQFKSKKDLYYPAIIFLIGLFIIIGHLGYLDIPRSFDHMSYSTLASLLKIEGTYPLFNIYAFPSAVYSGIPSGWIVMVSFISRLLGSSVPRTQLILAMLFFPFLGIGVYYISRMVFKGKGWAFSAGILALAMRMSSKAVTNGDMPEVLEWALVAFALFALFSYLSSKDKHYLIFASLSFFVSFIVHITLTIYTFGGLLFSLPFILLLKRNPKETLPIVLTYITPMLLVFILALPYILFAKGGSRLFWPANLSLMEFFENMIFRHGYLLIAVIIIGIPFFIRTKNTIMIFCFAYFVMFFLYFDQWLLWEVLKPGWYTKTFFSLPTYFGATGTYTSFFRFGSVFSQIVVAFNIVLPILFMYTAYKIISSRNLKSFKFLSSHKIAMIVFILFLIYESGIRPEVPAQLIGKADLQTAQWIREQTDENTTFIANIGSNDAYLWNISGISERKCLNYRELGHNYLDGDDPLEGLDFEDMLEKNPTDAVRLLKYYKFTHLLISEESRLKNKDFSDVTSLHKVYEYEINGKISRVFTIM